MPGAPSALYLNETRAWKDRAEALEKAIKAVVTAVKSGGRMELEGAIDNAEAAVKTPLGRY